MIPQYFIIEKIRTRAKILPIMLQIIRSAMTSCSMIFESLYVKFWKKIFSWFNVFIHSGTKEYPTLHYEITTIGMKTLLDIYLCMNVSLNWTWCKDSTSVGYFKDCTTPLSKPFLSKFFFFRIVCRIYVCTKFLCLRKVCLRNLCLRNVSLRKVCLRNMCLRKKSLSNVCLSKVCLRKVCLRNVCLRKVCLRQVCLESYTNFS